MLQEKVAGIESMCRTSRAPETVRQVMVIDDDNNDDDNDDDNGEDDNNSDLTT